MLCAEWCVLCVSCRRTVATLLIFTLSWTCCRHWHGCTSVDSCQQHPSYGQVRGAAWQCCQHTPCVSCRRCGSDASRQATHAVPDSTSCSLWDLAQHVLPAGYSCNSFSTQHPGSFNHEANIHKHHCRLACVFLFAGGHPANTGSPAA